MRLPLKLPLNKFRASEFQKLLPYSIIFLHHQGGQLNATRQFHGGRDLLPLTTENAECKAKSGFCFEAGDARNSEQPVLTAIHTLFMRLHNQVADELSRLNPQWSDETLYQEARRICAAVQQHITWNEFLPRVLGWNAVKLYELSLLSEGYFNGYDEKCNPTILNEFATAAFRYFFYKVKKYVHV